jgi:hypothetical protein
VHHAVARNKPRPRASMALIGPPAGTPRNAWMRPTFDIVAEIIALTCEVPRERITPDSALG